MTELTCKQALDAMYKVIAFDWLTSFKVHEEDCSFKEASRLYEYLKGTGWIVEAIPTHLLVDGEYVTLKENDD